MNESNAQLNAQSEAPTLTLVETLDIVKGFLDDNGETPVTFKQFDVCIAAKTNTDATFVANLTIRPGVEYPEAEGMVSWNDFDYYNQVAQEIQAKTVCPECEPGEGCKQD